MGTGEVLQEYLVSLGFKTDVISLRKFEDSLSTTGKSVLKFGMGVAGVVAGVEAAAAAFAYSMRKNFFAADLAGSTVQRIQALEYAGKQFGISADAMEGSVTNLARAFRLNPGMRAYAESLTGISTIGRDTTDVLLDLVKATKTMPEFVGANIMQQFGLGADDYHKMREHIDEIIAKRKEAADIQKQSGVDLEQQRKSIEAYTQAMDKLQLRFSTFGQTFLATMSPAFTWFTRMLDHVIEGWTYALQLMGKPVPQREQPAHVAKAIYTPEEYAAIMDKRKQQFMLDKAKNADKDPVAIFQSMGWSKSQAAGIVANLNRESTMNPNAQGDKDAKTGQYKAYGIAQWHPDRQANFQKWAGKDIHDSTLAEQLAFVNYELRTTENRAGKALEGSSNADDAGRIISRLYERPGATDAEAALRGTEATRLYNGASNAATVNSNVVINVTGTDAQGTAKAVGREQTRVLGDAIRNTRSALQ